jgi:hypothetical protein
MLGTLPILDGIIGVIIRLRRDKLFGNEVVGLSVNILTRPGQKYLRCIIGMGAYKGGCHTVSCAIYGSINLTTECPITS